MCVCVYVCPCVAVELESSCGFRRINTAACLVFSPPTNGVHSVFDPYCGGQGKCMFMVAIQEQNPN